MNKNKLYLILFLTSLVGYAYLFYIIKYSESTHFTVCIFKNVTGYACPSCGTTRAVELFLQGNFAASLQMNPFGIIIALLMVILPIWILFDVISKQDTLYFWYKKTENIIRTKWIAITLIVFVLLNWIWNLKKGL